jgi:hypothetical protein
LVLVLVLVLVVVVVMVVVLLLSSASAAEQWPLQLVGCLPLHWQLHARLTCACHRAGLGEQLPISSRQCLWVLPSDVINDG